MRWPRQAALGAVAVLLMIFLMHAPQRSLQENLFYLTLLAFLPLYRVVDYLLVRAPIRDRLARALPPQIVETLPVNIVSATIFALLLCEKDDSAAQVCVTWVVGTVFILSMMTGANFMRWRLRRGGKMQRDNRS